MGHKVYISFKTEDAGYKLEIQKLGFDFVDKSLNEPIDSVDEDYIMRRIREEYLADSTVTVHLIGQYGAEERGEQEQRFIKRELQASLYGGSTKNGILGIVLPEMVSTVYGGQYRCSTCTGRHNQVHINDKTTVREFSYNYYIPNGKCAHTADDRYCMLVTWDDFVADPTAHIEAAFAKRSHPIAAKTRVRP
ncbi:MAG: TIR domain-containing protein [Polyangiales bacterium]|nr:TIR domain-containing protein [Myxococcales bacterium]